MTAKRAEHPFQFVTQMNLTQPTGFKVHDLRGLLTQLKSVPDSVIHYHTHHFLKQHQYLSPEPPNDFAYWTTHVLQEERLGERLMAIDTVRFSSLQALREKMISVIEPYVAETQFMRRAPEGDELHLMKSINFFIPTPYQVWNLEEFLTALRKVSLSSLYHHMFEARIRLGKEVNDFSAWFGSELGEKELARWVVRLDPYTQTLEGLRTRIARRIEEQLRKPVQESVHAS